MSGGGSAANQAAWRARLGASVTFVETVGDDLIGSALVEELQQAGGVAKAARDGCHPTGTVACLIGPDGERGLVTSRGANAHLKASGCRGELLVRGRASGTHRLLLHRNLERAGRPGCNG